MGERGQTPIPALSQASQFCHRRLIQDLFVVPSCVLIETTKACLFPAAFRPPGADPSSATQAIDVPCQGAMTVPTSRRCFLPSPEARGQPFQSVAPPRATPAGRDPNGSVQLSCLGLANRPISSLGQDTQDIWNGFGTFPGCAPWDLRWPAGPERTDPSGVGASKRDSNHPAVQAHLAGQAPAPCPHPARSHRSQSHDIRESLEPRLAPSLLRDKRDCFSDPRPPAAAPSLPFRRTEHGEWRGAANRRTIGAEIASLNPRSPAPPVAHQKDTRTEKPIHPKPDNL